MARLLTGVFLALSASAAFADPIDDEIGAALKASKAPGVSVMAAKDGKVVLERAYGLANVEHQVPMAKDSVHELASVSKQFTAVAILLLDQEGKLSVNDKISKFFPDQGDEWDKVTVLNLLHHTSGLPDYLGPLGDMGKEWTKDEMIAAAGNKPLRFKPGSEWEYSNTGYMLLGFIVEQVSRGKLGEFLKSRFFGPLKMSGSVLNTMRQVVPNRADGYDQRNGGKLVREMFTSESLCVTGDGEVMSTVGDLWRWTDALHHGRILDAKHYEMFITPSKASLDGPVGYGCGIMIVEKDGEKAYVHGGGWTGTSTSVFYNPSRKFFTAILCNMGGAEIGPIQEILSKHFGAK